MPAYVLAMREFYPVRDARWRVPTLLLFSGSGMAAGAWLGVIMFRDHGPAFFAAIAANPSELPAIVLMLLLRQNSLTARKSQGRLGPAA